MLVQFPTVALQPGGLRPAGPAEVVAIGQRRVAGVLFNERPWAILEQEGETFIVKPGDIVDGVRVTAIARDAIFVVDPEGRRWQVPLRGPEPTAALARTGGMPELPSAFP
jgi:hypothetical protein